MVFISTFISVLIDSKQTLQNPIPLRLTDQKIGDALHQIAITALNGAHQENQRETCVLSRVPLGFDVNLCFCFKNSGVGDWKLLLFDVFPYVLWWWFGLMSEPQSGKVVHHTNTGMSWDWSLQCQLEKWRKNVIQRVTGWLIKILAMC